MKQIQITLAINGNVEYSDSTNTINLEDMPSLHDSPNETYEDWTIFEKVDAVMSQIRESVEYELKAVETTLKAGGE